MKNKAKIKNKIQQILTVLTVSSLLLFGLATGIYNILGVIETKTIQAKARIINFIMGDVGNYAWTITVPKTKAEEELPMKEWVKQEIEKAGLKWEDVNCIIEKESRWREDICIIEPNKTISCGLWMINTVHNKTGMTNACKVDYKCATEWAIKKIKRDNSYCAWTTAKACGLCK